MSEEETEHPLLLSRVPSEILVEIAAMLEPKSAVALMDAYPSVRALMADQPVAFWIKYGRRCGLQHHSTLLLPQSEDGRTLADRIVDLEKSVTTPRWSRRFRLAPAKHKEMSLLASEDEEDKEDVEDGGTPEEGDGHEEKEAKGEEEDAKKDSGAEEEKAEEEDIEGEEVEDDEGQEEDDEEEEDEDDEEEEEDDEEEEEEDDEEEEECEDISYMDLGSDCYCSGGGKVDCLDWNGKYAAFFCNASFIAVWDTKSKPFRLENLSVKNNKPVPWTLVLWKNYLVFMPEIEQIETKKVERVQLLKIFDLECDWQEPKSVEVDTKDLLQATLKHGGGFVRLLQSKSVAKVVIYHKQLPSMIWIVALPDGIMERKVQLPNGFRFYDIDFSRKEFCRDSYVSPSTVSTVIRIYRGYLVISIDANAKSSVRLVNANVPNSLNPGRYYDLSIFVQCMAVTADGTTLIALRRYCYDKVWSRKENLEAFRLPLEEEKNQLSLEVFAEPVASVNLISSHLGSSEEPWEWNLRVSPVSDVVLAAMDDCAYGTHLNQIYGALLVRSEDGVAAALQLLFTMRDYGGLAHLPFHRFALVMPFDKVTFHDVYSGDLLEEKKVAFPCGGSYNGGFSDYEFSYGYIKVGDNAVLQMPDRGCCVLSRY